MTTSQPHASVWRGREQTLLMPSTSSSLSKSPLTTAAIDSRSLVTPVLVSLWVTRTALTPGSPWRAVLSASTSTASPAGNLSVVTSAPKISAICPNRSPKEPIVAQMTLSPGERVLTIAASIAPVPEEVRMKTSPLVS